MRRRRRLNLHPTTQTDESSAFRKLSRLFFLRLMVSVRWEPERLESIVEDSDCLPLLGIPGAELDACPSRSAAHLKRILRSQLTTLNEQAPGLEGTPLGRNVTWLGERLRLSAVDCRILELVVLINAYRPLHDAVATLRLNGTRQGILKLVAILCGQPLRAVTKAFVSGGALTESGLLKLESGFSDFEDRFKLPDGLEDALLAPYAKPEALLERFFRTASPAKLQADDFSHLRTDFNLLQPLLKQAAAKQVKGLNILLYGEPGVGKSEFARLIAEAAGLEVFEVSNANDEGEALSGRGRFASYRLCQRVLAQSKGNVVLFDEIEDVFPSSGGGLMELFGLDEGPNKGTGKAWVNRALETNPVPALWISNRVHHIDPAYLRRFDFAVEVPKPPKAVRERVARKYFDGTRSSPEWIDQLADWSEVTPAQLEKAARVARLVNPRSGGEVEAVAERTLRSSAHLLRQEVPSKRRHTTGYRLDCLNTNIEVAPLIAGLQARPRGTFCFYGPPGTGKTALAQHIASAIDRPLLVKRASDLLSKWVGEAEQNIAAMFREARAEGAVLVLDEADSFLSDRRGASQSWEVSQVNEMLTHMEDFDGIFVCTTNLFERLDAAALRRFAFKLRFGFLKPEPRISLFEETWARLNAKAGRVPLEVQQRLKRLDKLTPGDFAAVARQHVLLGDRPEAGVLIAALEEECRVKDGAAQGMGFVI